METIFWITLGLTSMFAMGSVCAFFLDNSIDIRPNIATQATVSAALLICALVCLGITVFILA